MNEITQYNKILAEDTYKMFEKIDYGEEYTIKTHLLEIYKEAEENNIIEITNVEFHKKRFMYEIFMFMSFFKAIKAFFSKTNQKYLIKIYKIKFKRVELEE